MARQNFLDDEPWGDRRDDGTRTRVFDRERDHLLGSTLHEIAPHGSSGRLHMHFGAEELFFVLSGHPVLWNGEVEEPLEPGAVVHCPQGRAGLHTFRNPTDEPVRLLGVSGGWFPDMVVYPEHGYGWVASRNPDFPPAGDDPGVIARFPLPEKGSTAS